SPSVTAAESRKRKYGIASSVWRSVTTSAMEQPTISSPPTNSPQRMLCSSRNDASLRFGGRGGRGGSGVGSARSSGSGARGGGGDSRSSAVAASFAAESAAASDGENNGGVLGTLDSPTGSRTTGSVFGSIVGGSTPTVSVGASGAAFVGGE